MKQFRSSAEKMKNKSYSAEKVVRPKQFFDQMKNKSYSAEKVVQPKQLLAKKVVRPWPDRPDRRRRPCYQDMD